MVKTVRSYFFGPTRTGMGVEDDDDDVSNINRLKVKERFG